VSICPPATETVRRLPPKMEAKITRKSAGRARVKNRAWRVRKNARRSYRNRCRAIMAVPLAPPCWVVVDAVFFWGWVLGRACSLR